MAKITSGHYYHIYNRGNNKALIFFEERNYHYFLTLLKRHLHNSSLIYCYCLMPNHFHLFLKVEDAKLFERGIKNLLISYTKSFNKFYNRSGGLFEGRYRASKIESDNYFTRIITYIHQNPLRARLAIALESYRFSSYRAFLSQQPTALCRDEVLEWFGGVHGFVEAHKIESDFQKD